MKTTIETINGKQCTVIRKPFEAEWVREQLAINNPVTIEFFPFDGEMRGIHTTLLVYDNGFGFGGVESGKMAFYYKDNGFQCFESIVTTLPPLPRFPKKEHDSLIYLYKAHGIFPVIEDMGNDWLADSREEITHATDIAGNRVEIAITEAV